MNTDIAAKILAKGTTVAEHSGADLHREFNMAIDGRPWIHPGETIVEYEGRMYVFTMEGPFEPQK